LVAGVAAWLEGELVLDYFKPSLAASENFRDPRALNQEMPGVVARNGALTFGPLGGLLGLALGLAGGFSRKSAYGAVIGAIAGLILGTAAGALPSLVVMPWQYRHRNDDPWAADLLVPLLVHWGLWSGVGLAAGLAFGIGGALQPLRLAEAGLAGLVWAMVGTFVFEMAAALLFPMALTAVPISATAGSRLFARLCVAVFVALGALRCLPAPEASKAPPDVLS
jgi:hypothetical protein